MLPVCMGLNDEKLNEDGRNKNFWRPRKRLAAILYREYARGRTDMKQLSINEKPLKNLPESRVGSRNVNLSFILMQFSIALLQL